MVGSNLTASWPTFMAPKARSMAASSFSAASPAAPRSPDRATASSVSDRDRPGVLAEARKASMASVTLAGRFAPLV